MKAKPSAQTPSRAKVMKPKPSAKGKPALSLPASKATKSKASKTPGEGIGDEPASASLSKDSEAQNLKPLPSLADEPPQQHPQKIKPLSPLAALRAENERLKGERVRGLHRLTDNLRLRTENERLRAENEGLKIELKNERSRLRRDPWSDMHDFVRSAPSAWHLQEMVEHLLTLARFNARQKGDAADAALEALARMARHFHERMNAAATPAWLMEIKDLPAFDNAWRSLKRTKSDYGAGTGARTLSLWVADCICTFDKGYSVEQLGDCYERYSNPTKYLELLLPYLEREWHETSIEEIESWTRGKMATNSGGPGAQVRQGFGTQKKQIKAMVRKQLKRWRRRLAPPQNRTKK